MNPRRRTLRNALVGLGVALGLLAVVLYLAGPRAVLDAVASADRPALVLVAVVTVGWMAAWSWPLLLVLRRLGVAVTPWRAFLLYASVLFVASVAPFAVAGAQPIAALVVSRATGEPYERSFAAVASVDVLNYLPAPFFAGAGLVYFAVTASLGRRVEAAAAVAILLVLVAGAFLWGNRRRIVGAVPGAVARIDRRLGPSLPTALRGDSRTLEQRATAAVGALELIAGDRRTLAFGLAASTLGWLLFASILWIACHAVGAAVPAAVALFVVPFATVTRFVPLPGGLGGVDATLVVLLVLTTGLPVATATAAVLLHRGATLLLPVVVGGAAMPLFVRN